MDIQFVTGNPARRSRRHKLTKKQLAAGFGGKRRMKSSKRRKNPTAVSYKLPDGKSVHKMFANKKDLAAYKKAISQLEKEYKSIPLLSPKSAEVRQSITKLKNKLSNDIISEKKSRQFLAEMKKLKAKRLHHKDIPLRLFKSKAGSVPGGVAGLKHRYADKLAALKARKKAEEEAQKAGAPDAMTRRLMELQLKELEERMAKKKTRKSKSKPKAKAKAKAKSQAKPKRKRKSSKTVGNPKRRRVKAKAGKRSRRRTRRNPAKRGSYKTFNKWAYASKKGATQSFMVRKGKKKKNRSVQLKNPLLRLLNPTVKVNPMRRTRRRHRNPAINLPVVGRLDVSIKGLTGHAPMEVIGMAGGGALHSVVNPILSRIPGVSKLNAIHPLAAPALVGVLANLLAPKLPAQVRAHAEALAKGYMAATVVMAGMEIGGVAKKALGLAGPADFGSVDFTRERGMGMIPAGLGGPADFGRVDFTPEMSGVEVLPRGEGNYGDVDDPMMDPVQEFALGIG